MIEKSWINTKNSGKGRWKKYNFLLSRFGFPHVDDIKTWVAEDPENRHWGNMGYVTCNSEQDAVMVVLRWS